MASWATSPPSDARGPSLPGGPLVPARVDSHPLGSLSVRLRPFF